MAPLFFDIKPNIISNLPEWLSAIGTLGAVVIALYLSRRDSRITLSVEASQGRIITEGGSPNDGKYVWVTITNTSRRIAKITSIFWRCGIFKRNLYYWKVPRNYLSGTLPTVLNDGQEVSFFISADEFRERTQEIIQKNFKGFFSCITSRFVYVGARTTTGDFFKRKIKKSLREFLLDKPEPSGQEIG